MSKTLEKIKLPEVLAFARTIEPSPALMYACNWDKEDERSEIKVFEKTIRGTISNKQKDAVAKDPIKLNKEIEKPNIQRVDCAHLPDDKDTLVLDFTIKFLNFEGKACVSNNIDYSNRIYELKQEVPNNIYDTLAERYIYNLISARFLWRNRLGSRGIKVLVQDLDNQENKFEFVNTESLSMFEFDIDKINNKDGFNKLKELVKNTFKARPDTNNLYLNIKAYVRLAEGLEVFPSQEFVEKGNNKNDKGKYLYKLNNDHAAMHSQKIGNALRTIDTWYASDSEMEYVGPIAAEPYGAVTSLAKAYRTSKNSFYTLFENWVKGAKLNDDDLTFVLSILIRGGVFGGKSE